ncbi:MAG: peptidoglycan DD-metalloendopeptidase family protein [Clostridiales Family XIII bacterium]|jgi:murein DD-endopeptidase MepM/ murein hydrolase activator NlpD|nr:peptidoglycan DD-metalloendopeptidase family protein [Clostridiales Family XIII bacterium]
MDVLKLFRKRKDHSSFLSLKRRGSVSAHKIFNDSNIKIIRGRIETLGTDIFKKSERLRQELFARAAELKGTLNPTAAKAVAALTAVAIIWVVSVNLVFSPDSEETRNEGALNVTYGGEIIGYIVDETDFDTVLTGAKVKIASENSGLNVVIDDSKLAYSAEAGAEGSEKLNLLTADDIKDKLISSGDCKAEAWSLKINGDDVLTVASEQAANTVLAKVKSSYMNAGSELVEADIKEKVDMAPVLVELSEGVMTVDDAVSYVLTGTKEPKIYTVEKGDTLWDIAIANNISQAEIEKANPGLIPEKLKIDQKLNLYEVKPYVTIKTVEIASEVEPLAFSTTYENSDEFFKGQTKVIKPGVEGSREVKTQITKENGQIVDSVEIGAVITAEPQAQVSAVGTKPLADFTGTGSLMKPLANLVVSSAYGSRGSRRHQGVDFRSPKGTPIYASDDGVVTVSQYKGSYGNLVVLNHGNGIETYYGHCDTLAVSVGEVVNKGDLVGTVGITGNATGYHLHFEVRKNGVYQNPMNYF